MKFLNVVRRQPKVDAPPPPPPVPKRPPLPASLLARLVGLDPSRAPRLGERRRRPRLEIGLPIIIDAELGPQRQTFEARACDISAEGIGIEVVCALPTGTRFSLTIPLIEDEGFVALTYIVRRCELLPAGARHYVGGELLEYVELIADRPQIDDTSPD